MSEVWQMSDMSATRRFRCTGSWCKKAAVFQVVALKAEPSGTGVAPGLLLNPLWFCPHVLSE